MSDPTASLPGRVVRVLWLLLAALDGCLLVYLTVSYRWTFDVPVVSSHLGGLADAIMYAALAALTALVIAIVVAIGTAIVREFRPPSRRSRLLAGLAFVVLLIPLLVTIFEWVRHVLPLVTIRDTARLDRFEVFERFVEPADSLLHPAGLVSTDRISIGLYLAVLLGVAYLAEKYSLAWLRVRWPVPIVPIAMVASLVWVTRTGERVQREFVASREWRAVAEAQTFPEALQACDALGPDWTLPRPSELRLYTSTSPDAIRAWKGALWTNTVAERAANRGVVVEVAPRRSGVWRVPDTVNRSVSTCEIDVRERNRPIDAFTRTQPWLCESAADSPHVHSTDLVMVVLRRGTVAEFGQAGTVCVKRGAREAERQSAGRLYEKQQAFSTAAEYLAYVAEYCGSQTGPKDFICFALADDQPSDETGTERLYRLACDDEGRVEGCVGYTKLMDMRGDTERARQYRERAALLPSRRK